MKLEKWNVKNDNWRDNGDGNSIQKMAEQQLSYLRENVYRFSPNAF